MRKKAEAYWVFMKKKQRGFRGRELSKESDIFWGTKLSPLINAVWSPMVG